MTLYGHVRHLFSSVICAISAAVFAYLSLAVVLEFFSRYPVCKDGTLPAIGLSTLMAITLMLIILTLFRLITRVGDDARRQRVVALGLFLTMGIILFAFVSLIQPHPVTDSLEDIEAALYLIRNGTMDDNFGYVYNIRNFGNNYAFILSLMLLFRAFFACGATSVLTPLLAVNALTVPLAALVLWQTIRERWDIVRANRVLLLCALNPVYYGLACWPYTQTFSLPFMMGVIYVALRIERAETMKQAVAWGCLEGLLVICAYKVRATAAFPFVAVIVVGIFRMTDAARLRRYGTALLGVVVMSMLALTVINSWEDHYFSEMRAGNYPTSYWLSMGSHGEGTIETRREDWIIADAYETKEERSSALLSRTIENYQELGIRGTANLWRRKTVRTWANGYSGINARTIYGDHKGIFAEFIGGPHRQLFATYCTAFRLLNTLGIVLACIGYLAKRSVCAFHLTLLVTLLGGIAFYCVWEAKDVYSAPFIYPMIVLQEDALTSLAERSPLERIAPKPSLFAPSWRFAYTTFLMFAALVLATNAKAFGTPQAFTYYRTYTSGNMKFSEKVDFTVAEQSFSAERRFNTLKLGAKAGKRDKCSRYLVTLSNKSGTELASWTYGKGDVRDGFVILEGRELLPQRDGDAYMLRVVKLDMDKGDIALLTTRSLELDSYQGEAVVDGRALPDDLQLDVSYVTTEPYLKLPFRIAALGCAFIAVVIMPLSLRKAGGTA